MDLGRRVAFNPFTTNPETVERAVMQAYLNIYRTSRRLAARMEESLDRKWAVGYDEVLTMAICDVTEGCVSHPMQPTPGVWEVGGWGFWPHSSSTLASYTLTGIAGFDAHCLRSSWSEDPRVEERGGLEPCLDMSKYAKNEDLPKEHLYHPVKCEAEAARTKWIAGAQGPESLPLPLLRVSSLASPLSLFPCLSFAYNCLA